MSDRRARSHPKALAALFLLLVELAAFTATSTAQSEPAEIVKFASAPAECPSSDFINGRFFELVGSDAPSRGSASVEVLAVEQDRYDFVVEIETAQGRGVRRFTAKTCELGAETAALIVALSLFPERAEALERTARASAPTPPAAPEPEPPSAKPPPEPARPAPPPPATPPERPEAPKPGPTVVVSLNGGLDVTSMPRPAAGLGVGVGMVIPSGFLFEATAAAFGSQTVKQSVERSADFSFQSAGVHVCRSFERGRMTVSACAGATGVRIHGQGRGAERSYARTGYTAGPALGAALRLRLAPPLGARIYAESFVPVERLRFVLERAEVHELPGIGFSVFAGPELSF